MTEPKIKIECSFCSKCNHSVKHLIAGPDVYICNECVALCVKVISDLEKNKDEIK